MQQHVQALVIGGYAHHSEQSAARACLPMELKSHNDGQFEIGTLSDRYSATLRVTPLFDPQAKRTRGCAVNA